MDNIDELDCVNPMPSSESKNEVDNQASREDVEMETAFMPLGAESFEPMKPISTLPSWIKNAAAVSSNLSEDLMPVDQLKESLGKRIVRRLKAEGITQFFPVQAAVIPELLRDVLKPSIITQPRDVCVAAPTGSGKTLCYVLPIVRAIVEERRRRKQLRQVLQSNEEDANGDEANTSSLLDRCIFALVMLPVLELAQQVYGVFKSFASDFDINVVLVTGLGDIASEAAKLYSRQPGGSFEVLADIVVGTPGRLMDHLTDRNGGFCLRSLRYLVIDEADRMMADLKFEWLPAVERAVYSNGSCHESESGGFLLGPPSRLTPRVRPGIANFRRLSAIRVPLQKILLSATLSQDPERLQQLNLFQPKLFATNCATIDCNFALPETLLEFCVAVEPSLRPLVVHHLLTTRGDAWQRVLCFTRTREAAHRLTSLLKLFGHDRAKVRVLVCSDLLARGIDVEDVDAVISYDPPLTLQAYTHRIGRTARAGKAGVAFTLLSKEEDVKFKKLLESVSHVDRLKEVVIAKEDLDVYEGDYRSHLQQLGLNLETKQRTTYERKQRRSGVVNWKKRKQTAGKSN